jgi:hypothetical protein
MANPEAVIVLLILTILVLAVVLVSSQWPRHPLPFGFFPLTSCALDA